MQQQTINFEQSRPFIPVPLADLEQAANLKRVSANIASLVLVFFAARKPGDEFHINDLIRFVWRSLPYVVGDSPRRVAHELKKQGLVNYELESRSKSLYRVLAREVA